MGIYSVVYIIVPLIFYHQYSVSYDKLFHADQKVRYSDPNWKIGTGGSGIAKLNEITVLGDTNFHPRESFSLSLFKGGPFQIRKFIDLKKSNYKSLKDVHDTFPDFFKKEKRTARLKDILN